MRTAVAAIALALLAPTALAAAPASDWVVVAEESCDAGLDADQLTAQDWADLCAVEWRAVAGEDVPTTFEVRLRVAGGVPDRIGQTGYLTRWTAGECELELVHRDGSEMSSPSDMLHARCGEWWTECDDTTGVPGVLLLFNCRDVGDLVLDVPVTPPTFTEDTITWSVTFDGDLAPLAEVHAVGAVLDAGLSLAGEAPAAELRVVGDVPGTVVASDPYGPRLCISGVCTDPFADRLRGDITYEIR